MTRSHGIGTALAVAAALALTACVENSYSSKQGATSIADAPAGEAMPPAAMSTEGMPTPAPRAATKPAPRAATKPAPTAARPEAGEAPRGAAPAVSWQGPAQAEGYTLDGFRVYADDDRLWVFRDGSADLRSYLEKGEPAKRVTLIGEGPHGKTLLGADKEAMRAYALATRHAVDGFTVVAREGRLWVFRDGSEDLATFRSTGEPAKRVTLIGEGPDGLTLLGSDREVLRAYAAAARYGLPAFAVLGDDGRLWVFRDGSAAHREFLAKGEPAKRVTLIGAGPDGTTLMGADKGVLEDFAASHAHAAPGFVVVGDDGRLWVFRRGSPDLASFLAQGEPAKRVTLIGSGPAGRTLLGADRDAMEAYLRAVAD